MHITVIEDGKNVVLSGVSSNISRHNSLPDIQGGSLGQYYHLTSGEYANLATGDYYLNSNPSGYITGVDLSPYALQSSLTGTSGHLQGQITTLDSLTGTYYQNSNPSGYITGVDLSGYVTGDVVRPSDTGQFYPASNPSGYITGIDQISFSTLLPTGIEETGILFPYSFSGVPRVFADLALISDTGYLVGTKNITNTGYTAVFSDIIEETGLYLQTLATNI